MPIDLTVLHDLPWDNQEAKTNFLRQTSEHAREVGKEISAIIEEYLTTLEDDMPLKSIALNCCYLSRLTFTLVRQIFTERKCQQVVDLVPLDLCNLPRL